MLSNDTNVECLSDRMHLSPSPVNLKPLLQCEYSKCKKKLLNDEKTSPKSLKTQRKAIRFLLDSNRIDLKTKNSIRLLEIIGKSENNEIFAISKQNTMISPQNSINSKFFPTRPSLLTKFTMTEKPQKCESLKIIRKIVPINHQLKMVENEELEDSIQFKSIYYE